MREVGFTFCPQMVLALGENIKTMTRRLARDRQPDPGHSWRECLCRAIDRSDTPCDVCEARYGRPAARPGDLIYVREALRLVGTGWTYDADKASIVLPRNDPRVPEMLSWAHHRESSYCHARYMPRWAARYFLEVIAVRAERLHQISEKDAKAEGIKIPVTADGCPPGKVQPLFQLTNAPLMEMGERPSRRNAYRWAFSCKWEELNKRRAPWAWNPGVYVYQFRRAEARAKQVSNAQSH